MRISDWSSDVCSSDLVGQKLPLLTRIVMGVSAFLADFWGLLLILGGLALMGTWWALKVEAIRYRFDGTLLRLPVLGRLIRDLHAARMARTLSTLVASRLPLMGGRSEEHTSELQSLM